MPELPEVETIVRDLRPQLVGRRIQRVAVSRQSLRRGWLAQWNAQLSGRRVQGISRRGKWILIALEGERHLLIHLGMTGQLTVRRLAEPVAGHTHLVLSLDGGREQLRFRDIRRFGSATVLRGRVQLEQFFLEARLGPEPFDLDPGYWKARLAGTRRCLKAVLLDQRVLAGVGNIYADEALFEARLHPGLQGRALGSAPAGRLRRAIVTVLKRAIDKRGSSIRDYLRGSGRQGSYQREFRVYGRAGEPCLRCGRCIQRIRLAGRSTHFCPRCQKGRWQGDK